MRTKWTAGIAPVLFINLCCFLSTASAESTSAQSSIARTIVASTSTFSGNYAIQERAGFSGDSDNDTIPDSVDVDDDNDTIPDDIEGTSDSDGDGIADCLDLDSDNDGISDLYEAVAGTGMQLLLDADQNGVLDQNVVVGSNGLADIVELSSESGTSVTSNVDLDGDGVRDHQDLDADNDGIPDVLEAGSSDNDWDGKYDFFLDLNGDGMADRLTASPIMPRDTDRDGIVDYRDLDSDQDGLSDRLETSNVDTDSDGRVDAFVDVNVDGLHDGYMTEFRGLPDTDQDGFPDYIDTDSDGDGVSDAEEGFNNTVDSSPIVPSTPFNPSEPEPPITLETGDSGNVLGCSVGSGPVTTKYADPVFLLMLLGALLVSLRRRIVMLSNKWVGALLPLLIMTLLSGCAVQSPINLSQNRLGFEPYAGVGLGASFLNANTRNTTLEQDQVYSAAGQITLGTGIGERLAIELRAADLGEATFLTGEAVGYQVVDVSGLYKARFGKLSAFGRVGFGALFNDGDFDTKQKNKTHVLIGAGADYPINQKLSLRTEWQGHDVDVMHGQVSVLYRFGLPRQARPAIIATAQPDNEPTVTKKEEDFQEVPAKPKTPRIETPTVAAVPATPTPKPVPTPVEAATTAPVAQQTAAAPQNATDPASDEQSVAELEIEKIPAKTAQQVPAKPAKAPETQLALATKPAAPNTANPRSEAGSKQLKPLITVPVEKKIPTPRVDTDKDGIVDASDKCPGSGAEEPVFADGCSMFGDSVPGLTFFPDTDRLTKSAEQVLDTVAKAMKEDAEVGVTVAAHTRPSADANAAMFLTRRRTIAIIRYLSGQGIEATRLRPEAYGDTQPLASVVNPSDNDRVILLQR